MIIAENAFKRELIPKRPDNGCPEGTFDSWQTCFCEDHCSWEVCRLVNPPQSCLSKIDGKTEWGWDNLTEAWAAQGIVERLHNIFIDSKKNRLCKTLN